MATFAKASFNAASYLVARPSYPKSLYEYIQAYHRAHNGSNGIAVDVGCGPGVATLELANLGFDKVIGVDHSDRMLETGRKSVAGTPLENKVTFVKGTDATLKQALASTGPVDLITAAQAVHWFDFEKFAQTTYDLLRPNGTLALWGYVDHMFVGHPRATEINLEYSYGKSKLGPYWEQPGRNRLRDLLQHTDEPLGKLFVDVERTVNDSLKLDTTGQQPLEITKTVPLGQVNQYMKTFSSYHTWKEQHPSDPDLSDACFDEIKAAEGWSDDTMVTIKWASVLILASKGA